MLYSNKVTLFDNKVMSNLYTLYFFFSWLIFSSFFFAFSMLSYVWYVLDHARQNKFGIISSFRQISNVYISKRKKDKQVRFFALNRWFYSYLEITDYLTLCYRFELFIIFRPRALILGKSQLNSAFFQIQF